jgi:hypothetical protein
MQSINEKFTDEEFHRLKQIKEKYNYTWHDMIILAFNMFAQVTLIKQNMDGTKVPSDFMQLNELNSKGGLI